MSFILEALKKSEKKNQEKAVPRLETVHTPVTGAKSKRPKWFWAVLLVLILNSGLLLWLFGPWKNESPPPVKKIVSAQMSKAPAGNIGQSAKKPQAVRIAPTEERPPAALPTATIPAVKKPFVPPAPVEPAKVPSAPAERGDRIYTLAELPPTVRRGLPEMHISLHAFNRNSNAASLVRINDIVMREGAKLDGKYLLEKITAEGVVFRFDGYRFLIPRKGRVN